MSKPGPHPWATNDTYVSGPDAGSNTKTPPLTAHREDGYYRTRRPGPDILNYQLNRNALVQSTVARLAAMNYQLVEQNNIDYSTAAAATLDSSCHYYDADGNIYASLFYGDPGGTQLLERYSINGVNWATPASNPIPGNALGGAGRSDADGDDSNRRIIVHDGTTTDDVYYNTGYGAASWTKVTFDGGAPGLNWRRVACDRDTAGNGAAHWCIGDDAGGGNPVLWSSTDGISFTAEAGFPALGAASVSGIFHSLHPVGALGPDDTGNPAWLVLAGNFVVRSTDHITWTSVNPAISGTWGSRSVAYSRTSRRWVLAIGGTQFGTIHYSDDNGATWTSIANALPIQSAMQHANTGARIASDGYGTFVVTRSVQPTVPSTEMWVSVDEGLTWSLFQPADDTMSLWGSDDGYIIEPCFFWGSDLDETPDGGGFFLFAGYDDSVPATRVLRSLVT